MFLTRDHSWGSSISACLLSFLLTVKCVCVSGFQVTEESKVIKEPRVMAYLASLEIRGQRVILFSSIDCSLMTWLKWDINLCAHLGLCNVLQTIFSWGCASKPRKRRGREMCYCKKEWIICQNRNYFFSVNVLFLESAKKKKKVSLTQLTQP